MVGFLNPKRIIMEEIPLEKEMRIADLGCGSGGWAIPLAKRSKDAKIYAVDVLEEALSALRARAQLERVHNIRTIKGDLEKGVELKSDFFDLVIISNVLFQVEDKSSVIQEAHRILKKKGSVLIVDWSIKGDSVPKLIDKRARGKGFHSLKDIEAGEDHFAKLYEKQ